MRVAEKELLHSRRTDREDEAWIAYIHDEIRATPDRLEDAAKFIATMIGISLTIFLAIAKSGDKIEITGSVKAALLAWLLSLLLSFLVVFPFRYRCLSSSAQSIRQMHRRIVRLKWWLLLLSVVFFLGALSILIFKLL